MLEQLYSSLVFTNVEHPTRIIIMTSEVLNLSEVKVGGRFELPSK